MGKSSYSPLKVKRTKHGQIPELTRPSKREREAAIAEQVEAMLDEHDLGVKATLDTLLDPPKRR